MILLLPQSAFRKAQLNRNATIENEVVVSFASTQDKDYFKSLSYRLAGKKDHSMRLELPGHLLGQNRVLSAALPEEV